MTGLPVSRETVSYTHLDVYKRQFIAFAAAVLLHLPLPEKMPPIEEFLPLLPPGLRAFALYVQAHYLYLKEEYAHSAGIVEATLAMGADAYPISAIYLHLVAVMEMCIRDRCSTGKVDMDIINWLTMLISEKSAP